MNRDTQTIVRVLSENLAEGVMREAHGAPRGVISSSDNMTATAQLEIARQIALLTEEMRKIAKLNAEMLDVVRGVVVDTKRQE